MLYNEQGTHLVLSTLEFKRAEEDADGYKRIVGRSDLTLLNKELFATSNVKYGPCCIFPAGIKIGENCKVGSMCQFGSDTVFGDGCEFSAGCMFLPGTAFGKHCSIEGYELIGNSPLLIVQFPRISMPVYFANTTEGIIFCNRTLVEPLSAIRTPDFTMLFDGNSEVAKKVSRLLIEIAKEVYEQAETDESGKGKEGGGGQEG